MEPNSDLPSDLPPDLPKIEEPIAEQSPGPTAAPKNLYPNDVLANSELTDKLSGVLQNPQVSRYLGKATKVVVACAISGCILLVIAIFAVVNVLNMITSQIPQ